MKAGPGVLALVGLFIAVARAQGAAATADSAAPAPGADICAAGEGVTMDQFVSLLQDKVKGATLNAVIDSPKTAPSDKQVSAPASTSVSPDLVTSPDFTSLLGLAVDSGLISRTTGATTLNLNFFSFVAAMNPRVVQEQEQYARFTTLRRLSGSVTLGGQGDAIDQNGDGVVDDPKTAESSTDIVTWEIRVRLWGSRDRRDRENYVLLFKALSGLDEQQTRLLASLEQKYQKLHEDQAVAKSLCKPEVDAFIADPATRATINQIAALGVNMRGRFDDVVAQFDQSFLLTAVIGGTERHKDIYGPDKRAYGLRASYARQDMSFDANLDYNQIKSFRGADQQKSVKFGLAYNGTYMRDLVGYKDQGITVTLAAAVEKYHNVPDVAHDSIESVNLKFAYPVTQALSLPFSITWASHSDLLKDEKEVRGHIGFTYDLSPLLNKPTS